MSGNAQPKPRILAHRPLYLDIDCEFGHSVMQKSRILQRLFFTDQFVLPLPEGHKFPIQKYSMMRKLLEMDGLFEIKPAPLAELRVLELAHDPDYVQAFVQGTLPRTTMRRIGLPWSEALVQRALASVGGTMCAATDALNHGCGGTLGGGTHHAFRAEGAGFCVFNDIAVAIQSLRRDGLVRRAAVIDLDVHQGDGTAEIFHLDPDVFTLSVHCQNNFPFRKKQSRIDVSLPDKVEDAEYLRRLDEVMPEVFAFRPDILFYQSGVDGLSSDVLGRLSLTQQGLIERDRRVMLAARTQSVPLVVTSGGGYSRPIELSAEAHANTYRTALQVFGQS